MLRVLAATDFSSDGRAVVDFAADLVRRSGGKMYLLHAVEPCMIDAAGCISHEKGAMAGEVEEGEGTHHHATLLEISNNRARCAAEKISRRWDIPVYGKAEEADDIVECIFRFCERHSIQLLVIGNRHHSLLSSILLGSTAARLVRAARIPVTVVPGAFQQG